MGVTYIPNPQGTLPYKQNFSQVFGDSMSQVAATIQQYYERKKQEAGQAVDVNLKLMQAGLGGDPKTLIKSLKKAYNININEDTIHAMQVQTANRQKLEMEQQQAETQKSAAQAQLTQQQAEQQKQVTQWQGDTLKMLGNKDYQGLARQVVKGQLLGAIPKDFDMASMAAMEKMSPDQWDNLIKARQTQMITGQDPHELTMKIMSDPELVQAIGGTGEAVNKFVQEFTQTGKLPDNLTLAPNSKKLQQAMDLSERYGVDAKTALGYVEHPNLIPSNLKPLSVDAMQKEQQFREKEYGLRWAEFQESKKQFQQQMVEREKTKKELTPEQEARTKLLNKQIEAFDEERQTRKDDRSMGRELQAWRVLISGEKDDTKREALMNEASKALGLDVQIIHHWYDMFGVTNPDIRVGAGAGGKVPSAEDLQ